VDGKGKVNGLGKIAISFSDHGKGKVNGLGKIAISNDMNISNVFLV
jgi:hypothetical protein